MPSHRVPMSTLGTDQSQFNRGPFQKLHNLAMREADMVEPLPGRELVANNIGPVGYTARRMWGLADQGEAYEAALLRSAGNTFALRALQQSGSAAPTIASASLIGTPCGLAEARERAFYAGPRGALVFEEEMGAARMLGMLPPTLIAALSSTTTAAQAVPGNSRVAWRATLHRETSDYQIASAPSYAVYAEDANASTRDWTVRVGWLELGALSDQRVREGDILRLWRARAVTYGTSTNDRYLLAAERTLTSTDISNRYVDIRDVTPDAALARREELYTNPGIQGALEANWQLGPLTDVASYNQHTFYAQRSLPAYFELQAGSTVGFLLGTAQTTHGIGLRGVSGSSTNGSPTITSATPLTGIVAGQLLTAVTGGSFPVGARILSVNTGASTITMDVNATSTVGVESYLFTDMIDVNTDLGAQALRMANVLTLMFDAWDNNVPLIITPDDVVNGENFDFGTGLPVSSTNDYDGVLLRFDSVAPYGLESSDLAFTVTNYANYSRSEDSGEGQIDQRFNRVMWSKLDQPDHVPAAHELTVGAAEIVRFVSTQDRLFVFCTDGTYVISGSGGAWSVDRFDRDLVISNQAAADTMNGNVYVYAKRRGLLRIDPGGGITGLSKGAVQRELDALTKALEDSDGEYEMHLACDEVHSEVTLFVRIPAGGESADVAEIAHVFCERTSCWSTRTPGVSVAGPSALEAMCWSPRRDSLVWSQDGGSGGSAPDVYCSMDDEQVTEPIPGATLQTYPQVPAGTTGMQRFHEALLTISYVDDIDPASRSFTISAGVEPVGAYAVQVTPLPGNPATATTEQPAMFQARHMITRAAHIAPALVLNVSPGSANAGRWRLHAIDVLWQPESARSYSR